MKRTVLSFAIMLMLAGGLVQSVAAQAPPAVRVVYTSTFQDVQPPARTFDLVQGVSEFDPGQSARTNFSVAPRFFTVLEGAVTVLIGEETRTFAVGGKFSVGSRVHFGIRNDGSVRARVFFSVLALPTETGAQPAPGSTAPDSPSRILFLIRTSVTVDAPVINVVQIVQDWDAGARNSNHMMNHPHLYLALEGENTTRFFDGGAERFTAGQAGVMQVGRPGFMQNSGDTASRLVFTWLQTPGTPLTSPATPPEAAPPAAVAPPAPAAPSQVVAAPSAGDGGLIAARRNNSERNLLIGGSAIASLIVLAAGGYRLRSLR